MRVASIFTEAMLIIIDDVQDTVVGDLQGLSPNAQTMVKMAVLSAWAELQVASTDQKYLVKVLEPHIARLTPLWLSSLQEFARLRFEPDISNSAGPSRIEESLDTTYSALNRQTLLKVSITFKKPSIIKANMCLVLSGFLAKACRCYCKSDRPG